MIPALVRLRLGHHGFKISVENGVRLYSKIQNQAEKHNKIPQMMSKCLFARSMICHLLQVNAVIHRHLPATRRKTQVLTLVSLSLHSSGNLPSTFETWSHCVAKLPCNSQSSCLSFLRVRLKGSVIFLWRCLLCYTQRVKLLGALCHFQGFTRRGWFYIRLVFKLLGAIFPLGSSLFFVLI